jgi:hypothetical protein
MIPLRAADIKQIGTHIGPNFMFNNAVPVRLLTSLLIALAAAFTAPSAVAAVYKWVDENGKLHFSQTPPPEIGSTSKKVKLRGGSDDADFHIPPKVLEDYCSNLEEAAVKIAVKMREGYPATRALTSSHGSEMQLLGKQIIGFVCGLSNTRTTNHEIAQLVYNQCLNGSYNANIKRYVKKWHPELLEGEGKGDGKGVQPGTMMGTAWPVGRGYVLTNNHVVEDGKEFKLRTVNGAEIDAQLVKKDAKNDLALLKVDNGGRLPPSLSLASEPSGIGSEVFTIGFPHLDVMGYSPKLTTGVISNSGGPLLNMNGQVVGIVTSKLNADAVFRRTGDLPQNVNYALKTSVINDFLEGSGSMRKLSSGSGGEKRKLENLADSVQKSVMIIFAYR